MSNRFRPVYRKLDEREQAHLDLIKAKAEELAQAIENIPEFIVGRGRYVSLAITSLETSVMWAVKAATGERN